MSFTEQWARRLPAQEAALLGELHGFTARRLAGAERCQQQCLEAAGADDVDLAEAELHAFLRECWEALDGLAREVNLCMGHLLPEADLYPPLKMTRQCTFYMVRKKLHEHPTGREHPVSRLLWQRTRARPDEPYERLSFLYNLSLFFPLRLTENGRLPGSPDLPEAARNIVKAQHIERCDLDEGLNTSLRWVGGLCESCYGVLNSDE
ncbi:MAG: hypothetical protein R6V05_08685 [Candidatus Brocadiia bacterium]